VSGSHTRVLRDKLQKALQRERHREALACYGALEGAEPGEPRWPHRKGDLLKRLGRPQEAIAAYERAVELYARQGFVARAAAMAKVVMAIDPARADVFERVDPVAARRLHRSARSQGSAAHAEHDLDENAVTQTRRITAQALPLIPDDSAGDDMLRFTKPPSAQHPAPDLDISAAEVQDRSLNLDLDELSEPPTAEHLAQLPSMPLFAEVPRSVFSRLVRESRLIDLAPGECLIERGTTADALFTLVEGSVQIIRPTDQDVVVLSEGDVVGISCLLDRVTYQTDVTARTKVRALRISKLLLDELVAEYPPLGDILLQVLGRRLVATLVRTSPMFSSFDVAARSVVAAMFEVRRANKGTAILQAGKRADGLYIPMVGKLIAVRPNGEEVGTLKLGRPLGQHSMLTGMPSPLTAKAVSDVLVLRLSARRFQELVSAHPKMVAHLQELARHPSEPMFSLVPEAQQRKGA
jgi:CRP-like cAMP-binding protein